MQVIIELNGPQLYWSWPNLVYIWTKLWAHSSVWAKFFTLSSCLDQLCRLLSLLYGRYHGLFVKG